MRILFPRNYRLLILAIAVVSLCALSLVYLHLLARPSVPAEVLYWQGRLLAGRRQGAEQRCDIAQLDPWDPAVRRYIDAPGEGADRLRCKWLQYELVYLEEDRDRLLLNLTALVASGRVATDVRCTAAAILKNAHDDRFHYGDEVDFARDVAAAYYDMREHFARVDCYETGLLKRRLYTDFFAGLTPPPPDLVRGRGSESEPAGDATRPNVLLFGIDSMSLSNMRRQMPLTMRYLADELNATVLRRYHKVWDNTFGNWVALLAGKLHGWTGEFATEVSELYGKFYDDWTFLEWYKYREAGYVTLFAEDAPLIQTFNYYGMWGFERSPTDYYFRPLVLAMHESMVGKRSSAHCVASRPLHVVQLQWVHRFVRRFGGRRPVFAMNWLQALSHDRLNYVGVIDSDVRDHLAMIRPFLDGDTVLVFYSDHGHRYDAIRETIVGRLEARLPAAVVRVGGSGARAQRGRRTLALNEHALATPFDVHATLVHLRGGGKGAGDSVKGYSLLSELVPAGRTCAAAYIPAQYCACMDELRLDNGDAFATLAARHLVRIINDMLGDKAKGLCHTVELDSVLDARASLPKGSVVVDPQVSDTAASGGYELQVRVAVSTRPAGGQFEALLAYDMLAAGFRLRGGDIERNNAYGNSSACVRTMPLLKKLCTCL